MANGAYERASAFIERAAVRAQVELDSEKMELAITRASSILRPFIVTKKLEGSMAHCARCTGPVQIPNNNYIFLLDAEAGKFICRKCKHSGVKGRGVPIWERRDGT